ncbi:hypothetical protein PAUR_a1387 [Pseudoalteromonas aurantia 208]|uniref:Lipoprotein n=2 Tax=Pseudoalteromonas aurantia TaxID=43654 RepID=A0ABR9EAA7_9GAMM|nr:hypothetical protein [Pseudoalteromonas aurantia 208]
MEEGNMKNILSVVVSCVVLAGCNATDDEADKQARNTNGYKCEQIRVLGSSIPKKVCSTREQRKEAEIRSKEATRNAQRPITLNGIE